MCIRDRTNPLTETFTLKCVEYVFKYLERAVADGNDLEARYHMSFASLFGMMSYTCLLYTSRCV